MAYSRFLGKIFFQSVKYSNDSTSGHLNTRFLGKENFLVIPDFIWYSYRSTKAVKNGCHLERYLNTEHDSVQYSDDI